MNSERIPATGPQRLEIPARYSPACKNVVIESGHRVLSEKKLRLALENSRKFKQAGLLLTDHQAEADVRVMVQSDAFGGPAEFRFIAYVIRRATAETRLVPISGLQRDPVFPMARDLAAAIADVCRIGLRPTRTSNLRFTLSKEDRQAQLRGIRSLEVQSTDTRLDEEDLRSTLERLPAIKLLRLNLDPNSIADAVADISQVADRENSWKVEIVSRRGELLAAQNLYVIHSQDVPRRFALSVLTEFASASAYGEPVASSLQPERSVAAEVKLFSGVKGLPQGTHLTLAVEGTRVQVLTATGAAVASIPQDELEDVAGMVVTEPMDREEQANELWSAADESTLRLVSAFPDPYSALAVYLGIMGFVTVDLTLDRVFHAPIRHRIHFLDIAWSDAGRIRTISLEVKRSEAKKLFKPLDGMVVRAYRRHQQQQETQQAQLAK